MPDQNQYVTLGVAEEKFAAPVTKVQEILDMRTISRLPRAPENLLGMIDVRGQGVPVVDLRRTLGMEPAPDTENTRIVVLAINGIVLIRREGAGPAHALSLAMGLGILAYVGLAGGSLLWDAPRLGAIVVLLGFPLMYLGFVFTDFVSYSALYLFCTGRWGKPVDAVIVLGAGLRDGRMTPLLRSRLDHGIEVFQRSRLAGRMTILMPSGGKGSDEPVSEAAAMASSRPPPALSIRSIPRARSWSARTRS